MKVALIRQKFTHYGGAELYVTGLAKRLMDRGHEVHLLARDWNDEALPGVVFHPIRIMGGPTFIKLRSFARQVEKSVNENRFDLVYSFERTHSQDIFRAGDGCHIEWLSRRARAQGAWRGFLDGINPRHRAFLDMEARLFSSPRLKIVMAISEQGRDEIVRHYGFPSDKIEVLYNGVDRSRFYPGLRDEHRAAVRQELSLEPDEPVLLFVGSGFLRKGLGEVIRALPKVEARLLVIGKDNPKPFAEMARRLGVGDRVAFLGPRRDVERLYGAADAFVLPSWYEPFGSVFLEALASGLPVVTTNEVGGSEAVTEGVNGFTVGFPVDADELAEKLERALKLDRTEMLASADRLLAPFNWDDNVDRTMKVFERILDEV